MYLIDEGEVSIETAKQIRSEVGLPVKEIMEILKMTRNNIPVTKQYLSLKGLAIVWARDREFLNYAIKHIDLCIESKDVEEIYLRRLLDLNKFMKDNIEKRFFSAEDIENMKGIENIMYKDLDKIKKSNKRSVLK